MDISKADCEAAKANAIDSAEREISRIESEITILEAKREVLEAEIKLCIQTLEMLMIDQNTILDIQSECITKANEGANLLAEISNKNKNNFTQGAFYAGQDTGNSNDYKVVESVGNNFTDTIIPGMEKAVNNALTKLTEDLNTIKQQKSDKEAELKTVENQIKELKRNLEAAKISLSDAQGIYCPDDPPERRDDDDDE